MEETKKKIAEQLGELVRSVDVQMIAFISGYLFCWHELAGSEQFDEHFADECDRDEIIDLIHESYVDGYLKLMTPETEDIN